MATIATFSVTEFENEKLRELATEKGFVGEKGIPNISKAAQLIVRNALNKKKVF